MNRSILSSWIFAISVSMAFCVGSGIVTFLTPCHAGVFDGTPKAVTLPEAGSDEPVGIAVLETGSKTITMEILGGTTAIAQKKTSKKKKKEGEEPQLHGYTLIDGKAKKEGEKSWLIKYNEKGRTATAATLTHDGKTLNFKWNTKVPKKLLAPVGNCVLKLVCESETHYLALREPIRLELIELNIKTASGSLKTPKLQIPFPSQDVLVFEMQNLGKYQPGNTSVVIPPATKISEIDPKVPMQIMFNFTDKAGNVRQPFLFNITLNVGNIFGVTIAPPPEQVKQVAMELQKALDPQIDITISNLKKRNASLAQKMEKQQGWQRDGKDTNEIAMNEMYIWAVGHLKVLANAQANVRLYADYGEMKMDLVVTDVAIAAENAEQKKSKSKKSQKSEKEEGESDEDNAFGGMKF
ncbi:MAG: hypothetical protein Q4C70_14330 [Planctomycetia bacterium]|nr:hypothetical protein [Planctomycetia bacterium]